MRIRGISQLHNQAQADARIAGVIAFHLALMVCKNMLVSTSEFFFEYNGMFNTVILVAVLGVYLWLFLTADLFNKIPPITAIIIIAAAFFMMFSHLKDPLLFVSDEFPYDYVKRQLRTFIAYCLPLFVVSSAMSSMDALVEKLYKSANIIFYFAIFGFVLSLGSQSDTSDYSMAYGNAVMYGCTLFIFRMTRSVERLTLIKIILSILFILISGSRGPLACIAIAIVVAYFRSGLTKRKIMYSIITLGLGVGCVLFWGQLQNTITAVLSIFGVQSRSINMIFSGTVSLDSGRSIYHDKLLEELNQHPLVGLGAFGGEKTVGLAHSVYYDIFANFGYVVGAVYLIFMAYEILITVFSKNRDYSDIILLFSVLIIPRGFFDDTFWGAKELWMIMGVLISYRRSKKAEERKKALSDDQMQLLEHRRYNSRGVRIR